MSRYYYNAQWTRFVCAIYLVIYHSVIAVRVEASEPASVVATTFGLGFFATSVFFVLSGFLMSHAYAQFVDGDVRLRCSPGGFLVSRLSAIYPIHIASLILYLLVAWIAGKALIGNFGELDQFLGRAPWQKIELSHSMFWTNLVLSAALLQAWNPEFLSLNGASWSLSALLFFYAVFPWVMPRLLRVRRKRLGIALLIAIYILPALVLYAWRIDGGVPTGMMHRNPLLRLPEFLSGILLFGLMRERGEAAVRPIRLLAACIALVLLLLTAGYVASSGPRYVWYVLHNGALLPGSLLAVYLVTSMRDMPGTRLGYRLGGASLGIFALHAPIGLVFKMAVASLGQSERVCPPAAVACSAGLSQGQALFVFFVYLSTVIVAALVAQRLLVEPASRMLREWWATARAAKTFPTVIAPLPTSFKDHDHDPA